MQVAIVTGGAKGLGKALCLMLASAGYAVVVDYKSSESDARATVAEIERSGGKAVAVQADVTAEQDVKNLVAAAATLGQISVLVHNVGDFLYKPLLQTTQQEFLDVVNNNAGSLLLLVREIVSHMKNGRIIVFGSTGVEQNVAPEMTTPYYIAKTGVLLMAKNLARALPAGTTINCISPSVLETSPYKPEGVETVQIAEVVSVVRELIASERTGEHLSIGEWTPT